MLKIENGDRNIWDEVFFCQSFSGVNEKLLYLYLLTNPLSNIAGVYQLLDRRILYDTGLTATQLSLAWDVLKKTKKAFRYGPYVIIKDMPNYIDKTSKKNQKALEKILRSLPAKVINKLDKIHYNIGQEVTKNSFLSVSTQYELFSENNITKKKIIVLDEVSQQDNIQINGSEEGIIMAKKKSDFDLSVQPGPNPPSRDPKNRLVLKETKKAGDELKEAKESPKEEGGKDKCGKKAETEEAEPPKKKSTKSTELKESAVEETALVQNEKPKKDLSKFGALYVPNDDYEDILPISNTIIEKRYGISCYGPYVSPSLTTEEMERYGINIHGVEFTNLDEVDLEEYMEQERKRRGLKSQKKKIICENYDQQVLTKEDFVREMERRNALIEEEERQEEQKIKQENNRIAREARLKEDGANIYEIVANEVYIQFRQQGFYEDLEFKDFFSGEFIVGYNKLHEMNFFTDNPNTHEGMEKDRLRLYAIIKNYFRVLNLVNHNLSWWNNRCSFSQLCKNNTINYFNKDNFDLFKFLKKNLTTKEKQLVASFSRKGIFNKNYYNESLNL